MNGRIDGRPTEPVPGRPPIPKAVEARLGSPLSSGQASVAASSYPSVPDEEAGSAQPPGGWPGPAQQLLLPTCCGDLCRAAQDARRGRDTLTPLGAGGTRTLVRDADGFIFRPSVEVGRRWDLGRREVEAKPVPKPRLRPQRCAAWNFMVCRSRGLNDLVASLSKKPQKRLGRLFRKRRSEA